MAGSNEGEEIPGELLTQTPELRFDAEQMKREIDVMSEAVDLLSPLTPGGRARVVLWLVMNLGPEHLIDLYERASEP